MIDRVIIYGALLLVFLTMAKVVKESLDFIQVGDELENISCGEALNRANKSAAPRDAKEETQFYDCIINGTKRWDNA